jgi:Arc/MetJ-type ribon-helix-helix transcriptional regulator
MKPITHHLTEQQIERLRSEAQRSGLTVAEIIRRAVDAWLDRADKERRKKES